MTCGEQIHEVECATGCGRAFAVFLLACLALNCCHRLRAPLSPSLNLPGPVRDLATVRADDEVWLTWTMPQRTTDERRISGDVIVRVCRQDSTTSVCADAGEPFLLAPGATGSFSELLPAPLASGTPRVLHYFVELKNRNGQSAGFINHAATLAGAPPSPVQELTAEMNNGAVRLCWLPAKRGDEPSSTVIRLYRKFLTQGSEEQERRQQTLRSKPPEQDPPLEVSPVSGCAVDKNIRIGQSYEYRAQRVARVNVNGHALELAGFLSEPVRIRTVNVSSSKTPGN